MLVALAAAFILFLQIGAEKIEPRPWPLQFHSLLVREINGKLATIDLWYDWPNGRNFNIIHEQLGATTHDLEWTNGTSFFYDLEHQTCRTVHVPVGILRPNWLEGAEYLGVQQVNGFTCNYWQKVDFITYWEDVVTKVPVRWIFYTGRKVDVLTFEVGAVLPDIGWQAPAYCFPLKNQALRNLTEEKRWLSGLSTSSLEGAGSEMLKL